VSLSEGTLLTMSNAHLNEVTEMRKIFFILLIIIVLLVVGFSQCSKFFSLTTSEKVKEWKIDEYSIVYARKLGPAGPNYYQYDVYKTKTYFYLYSKEVYLSYSTSIVEGDSCQLIFRENEDYHIKFNLCDKTKKVVKTEN
jgi:hypothetical protein